MSMIFVWKMAMSAPEVAQCLTAKLLRMRICRRHRRNSGRNCLTSMGTYAGGSGKRTRAESPAATRAATMTTPDLNSGPGFPEGQKDHQHYIDKKLVGSAMS